MKIDPEIKRRWFNPRWFAVFNLPVTALLTPSFAEYQYVWHGNRASLAFLTVQEWMISLGFAFVFSGTVFFLIGDGWVYFKSK